MKNETEDPSRFNLTLLLLLVEHKKLLPLTISLLLLIISRLRFFFFNCNSNHYDLFWIIETWASSPPNLSLIGPLTAEIYYRTGITGNTDTQTQSDILPI